MKKFLHELADFENMISALSAEIKFEPQLIEKDYWIMHALWGLQNLGFNFELKGGTSLSKGWNCIDRFSEDLDIQVHPPSGISVPSGKIRQSQIRLRREKNIFKTLPIR